MATLRTYADWKHCIVELCQIPLTPAYVDRRLDELRDDTNAQTRKFVTTWGETHRNRVIDWFEQAKKELSNSAVHESQ